MQGCEEGFFGSWYLARVTAVNEEAGVIATLRYFDLLKDDGTAETEALPDAARLRPPLGRWLSGAERSKRPLAVRAPPSPLLFRALAELQAALTRASAQLAAYEPGDAVEVLHEEGWCAARCALRRRSFLTPPARPPQVGGLHRGHARHVRDAQVRHQPGGRDEGSLPGSALQASASLTC